VSALEGVGFSSESLSASSSNWGSIESAMGEIYTKTRGKERIVYVHGSETFFRKVVCASMTAGLTSGITWLSQGTWRHDWWRKSDMSTSFHRQWLKEDVGGTQLKDAFAAFKRGWDSFRPSVEETREALQDLYATDEKDALLSVDGPEAYHAVHAEWHPVYRKLLYDRSYYDIFIFDTNGDMIYSVYKESDYATNFAASGTGQWKESGLGDAFEAAMASPDEVTYIDWKPYGPSGDAPAAFFATGLRNKDGEVVGAYAIQLPPEFEKSIEDVEAECSMQSLMHLREQSISLAAVWQWRKTWTSRYPASRVIARRVWSPCWISI